MRGSILTSFHLGKDFIAGSHKRLMKARFNQFGATPSDERSSDPQCHLLWWQCPAKSVLASETGSTIFVISLESVSSIWRIC